jgi:hypothetical protein
VLDAQLLQDAGWEDTRGEGAAEDGFKLLVQPTWQRQQGTRNSMWAEPRLHK